MSLVQGHSDLRIAFGTTDSRSVPGAGIDNDDWPIRILAARLDCNGMPFFIGLGNRERGAGPTVSYFCQIVVGGWIQLAAIKQYVVGKGQHRGLPLSEMVEVLVASASDSVHEKGIALVNILGIVERITHPLKGRGAGKSRSYCRHGRLLSAYRLSSGLCIAPSRPIIAIFGCPNDCRNQVSSALLSGGSLRRRSEVTGSTEGFRPNISIMASMDEAPVMTSGMRRDISNHWPNCWSNAFFVSI